MRCCNPTVGAELREVKLRLRAMPKMRTMSSVFDPLRTATIYVDALAVTQGSALAWHVRREQRLVALLRHAAERSVLYRRLWGDRGGGATETGRQLADLPPVHKADLMRRFDEWVTDPQLTLEGLRAFVADPARIGTPFLGRYIVWESSGSSGEPALFVQDAESLAVGDALQCARGPVASALPSWLMPRWSLLPTALPRLAFVGAVDGHFASVVSLARLARVNPWLQDTLRTFSFLQPVAQLVAALNEWQPSVLSTYPSMARVLAGEHAAGRLHVAPREIWTGGETLTATLRAALATCFGAAVRDSYGASECLEIATECRCGRLHLNADWVILEPVDERLHPVPDGEVGADVLLTHLGNRVQPIVRYALGDRVRIVPEPCRCGSALPLIEVQGREDELLCLNGRDGAPVQLAPLALVSVLEDGAGVFDFELCRIAPTGLRLTLYGADAETARVAAARRVLHEWLRTQGLGAVALECRARPGATGRGRSGKRLRVRDRADAPPADPP
ncbi:MAG: phenylacetate--CoA ligase family protein [Burkholderiales bacterium]|nr:phenylacetate--CoA ligase family protein [Burkholderiales bacterium]